MENGAVDHEFLLERRRQMTQAENEMRSRLLARGVPSAMASAIVQKHEDHHAARWTYLQLRNQLHVREDRVRKGAIEAGQLQPTAMPRLDPTFLQSRKEAMEACTAQIVRWMEIDKIEPHLRLSLHQSMIDADYGRSEELRLIQC